MARDWEREKIGNLLDFKNGLNKGKQFFGSGTPIVNYTDVYKKRGLKKCDVKGTVTLDDNEIRRYEVRKGDVFFTRTSETPEEVGISSVLLEDIPDCAFSGFVLRGRPKTDRLVPEYCKYCFSTQEVRREIITRCTYTTRALTNGKQLSAIDIPVPERSEQKVIAETLTDMDDLIASIEMLVQKKKRIHKGAVYDYVTGKKRMPDFNSDWEYRLIGSMTKVSSGGTPSTTVPAFWGGEIPWMNSGELNQKLVYSVQGRITEAGLASSSTHIIPKGCVLIGLAGQGKTRGTAAINFIPLCTNQSIGAIYPSSSFDSLFLYYLMDLKYKELREISSGDGSRGGLTKSLLESVEVYLPSDIHEQEAVGKMLFEMDMEIAALNDKLTKYRNIKTGMMDELLTGKIRLV